jgi:hypothetical protein
MAESPASDLTSLSSEDFTHGDKAASSRGHSLEMDLETPNTQSNPYKRLKTGNGDINRRESNTYLDRPDGNMHMDDFDDLSSDTSGSVPGSPGPAHTSTGKDEGDDAGHEQVTTCRWDGCEAGDLGNMDELVRHIHDDHIGSRQKKYACEWDYCSRKGMPHASGYALRAHMRSHTREKPFFCALPGKCLYCLSSLRFH